MKCADVYKIFFETGEVTEIRAYGLRGKNKAWEGFAGGAGIVFGYFDNADYFGNAAEALDRARAPGIYFTLNPCFPDILARAANRLMAATQQTNTTADKNIKYIRWLPIDIDAKQPHELKISSTAEELTEALRVRNEIYKWLRKRRFPEPIPACSGNGGHLLYRLEDWEIKDRDKINEDLRVLIIKSCLQGLAKKFNSDKVDIDTSVFNPSRIWRLYGTTARKGDSTTQRPHRRSYIEPKFLRKE